MWAGQTAADHISVYNAIFATVQLLIGFGQLLTGQSQMLTGAPGGVLPYGLIGWAVWPAGRRGPIDGDSAWSPFVSSAGRNAARWSLGLIFLLGAALHLQPDYLTTTGMGNAFSAIWPENRISNHGVVTGMILFVIQWIIGIGILVKRPVRWFTWAAIIVFFLFWWVGQDFGQMFTAL